MESPRQQLLQAFRHILSPEGFVESPGPWLSLVKDMGPLGQLRVDATRLSGCRGFSVTLQKQGPQGPITSVLLEECAGRRHYNDPNGYNTTLASDSIADAAADLAIYAIPWFAGKEIVSSALGKNRFIANKKRRDDLIMAARQSFRVGDFASAITSFEAAAAIESLDGISLKYLELARRNR